MLLFKEMRGTEMVCERTLEVTGQAVGHVLVEVLDTFGQFVRFQLLRVREEEFLVFIHDMSTVII